MGDGTHISWTEATWNPILGCTHLSPGCDNCYAARLASGRLAHLPAYAGLATAGRFTGEVRLLEDRLTMPLRWRRPRRIFVNSMSDLFHDSVPDDFIARVFRVMGAARQHTFQVLTKRHARMRALLRSPDFDAPVGLDNVWVGVSVETQQWADIRIPALLETPAAVRWISAEPLLGPVDLVQAVNKLDWLSPASLQPGGIDWVVAGGESGPHARPARTDWFRQLRDQCEASGVPYHFKQWGEYAPQDQLSEDVWRDIDAAINLGGEPHPDPLRVGVRRAGRLLDGVIHDAYPEPVTT